MVFRPFEGAKQFAGGKVAEASLSFSQEKSAGQKNRGSVAGVEETTIYR